MARVQISDFGIIQKGLAYAVVTFYVASSDGSPSSTKATLYQASTGSDARSNPQTLDADGKLANACYVETNVVATIDEINATEARSLKKIRENPLQYQLSATNSKFGVIGVESAAEAAASAAEADLSATAAETAETNAETAAANAETAETAAETAQAAAETARDEAQAAVGGVQVSANDTTPDNLEAKLLAGDGITASTQNDGANETRTLDIDLFSGGGLSFDSGQLQISDDGVTLAKMAGGTDGNLITYDANGDPAYVSTGTSGQVLKSNGAGAAPTFEDEGTSDMNTSSSETVSNDSTVDFSGAFEADNNYDIEIAKLTHTHSSGSSLYMRVEHTSTFQTASDYKYCLRQFLSDGTNTDLANNGTATAFLIGSDCDNGGTISGKITINNPNSTGETKIVAHLCYKNSSGTLIDAVFSGVFEASTEITGVQFYFASGNASTGVISIEKKNNS